MEWTARISAIYLGFFSQIAQVIILREALAVFAGVEMIIGSVLAVWLVAIGIGSVAGNRMAVFHRNPQASLGWLYFIAGVLLPVTILGLRQLPGLLGFAPGEIVGPVTTLLGANVTIAPITLILGLLFTANARVLPEKEKTWVGSVYLLEAAGAATGGIFVTFAFIPQVSHLVIAFAFLLMSVLWGLAFLHGRATRIVGIPLTVLIVVLTQADRWDWFRNFDISTRPAADLPGEVLALVDSPYGQLTVSQYVDQLSLHRNGALIGSYPDRAAAEEIAHFPLLAQPNPRQVLLIGGGGSGALRQIQKHGTVATYVDLDPSLVPILQRYSRPRVLLGLDQAEIILRDPRIFLQKEATRYDVIILELGEPSTALVNRFYTREFFAVVQAGLTDTGVFAFRMPSAENYIAPERARFLATLQTTLREVFPEVVVLPGATNVFLAANSESFLPSTAAEFVSRLMDKNIQTEFITAELLPYRLNDENAAYLQKQLRAATPIVNTDLHPICYYFNAILWSTQFGDEAAILTAIEQTRKWYIVGFVVVVLVLLANVVRPANRSGQYLASLLITGFSGLAAEVILIYCFQVELGVVYGKIGLLTACFMAGLSVGSFVVNRRQTVHPWIVAGSHVVVMVFAFAFLTYVSFVAPGGINTTFAEAAFYLFSTAFGYAGGALFVGANRMFLDRRRASLLTPVGTGYAMDVLGSALGALMVSAVLIPLWGVTAVVWVIIGLNAMIAASIAIKR